MAEPKSLGFDPIRLKAIDRHIAELYVGPGRLPGAILCVERRGQPAHLSIQGLADREAKMPFALDSIVRIYSMTKPIVSIAFMMLFEEGRVQLDDPVARYIPEWSALGVYVSGEYPDFQTVAPARPMQIIDLLRHTSGLTYGFQFRTPVDAAYRALKIGEVVKSGTLESMVRDVARLPLEFSPGERWNYGISTDVVGYLIEKISGQRLDVFLQERILEPLGMSDTGFFVPPEKLSRLAACYFAPTGHDPQLFDSPTASSFAAPPEFFSGGGGLVSTLADYLTFCRMLMKGGEWRGKRYISRSVLDLMTTSHLGGRRLTEMSVSRFSEAANPANAGLGFGLGFSVNIEPARNMVPGSVGDYGWGGWASTSFWIDPKEELICILLAQTGPSSAFNIRRELRTMIYSAMSD